MLSKFNRDAVITTRDLTESSDNLSDYFDERRDAKAAVRNQLAWMKDPEKLTDYDLYLLEGIFVDSSRPPEQSRLKVFKVHPGE
jgi:hypothetical protein